MRESHRLLMKAWELGRTGRDRAGPDQSAGASETGRTSCGFDSLNARVGRSPWRLAHTVLMICFGVINRSRLCGNVR